jgi:hypothetical protein
MKTLKTILLCAFIVSILITQADEAWSEQTIDLSVKTILASQKPGRDDPSLKRFKDELEDLFRYSSYKLLSRDNLRLNQKNSGIISLPGNRSMKITSKGISGDRVTLQVEMFRNNKQIFQTVVRLLNDSEVTVGGPKHEDGNLLINIFASF